MKIEPNNIYHCDCYKAIKDIPDKSVDLIYTDIPYLVRGGGGSQEGLNTRIQKMQSELGNKHSRKVLEKKRDELREKMNNAKDKYEYEKYHVQYSNILNKLNLESADIVDGIDYSLFDELCRVMKYIYIYGVAKNKYMILCNISLEKKVAL